MPSEPVKPEPVEPPREPPAPSPSTPSVPPHLGPGGRQSDPHHVVRNRAWKERHSDMAYDRRTHHGPSPQRPMNPGVNVWVSTNGQLSGNSASDKALLSGSQGPGLLENPSAPALPPRRPIDRKVDMRHAPQQPKEDRASQDSGNPLIEITEVLKSPGSGSSSATATVENPESLIDVDPTEPLTLSEQQNSRIDESRLSAALSMFDPFSAEGDGDPATLSTNANNNRSVETLKEDSAFVVSSGAGDNLANVPSRSVDSAIELLCEDDSAFKDVKVNGGAAAGVSVDEKGKGAQQKTGMGTTTPVAGTAAGFLQRDSPDNISLRSDDKDFTDGDDSDRANKKGSGFFKTFRDKLHKGIKRKTTKLDKDALDAHDDSRSSRGEGGDGSDTGSGKIETSDDILAKYRTPKKGAAGKHGSGNENADQGQDSVLAQNGGAGEEDKLAAAHVEENTPFLDPSNLEGCFAFQDAKRKLRLVLSMCEIQPGFFQMQSQSPRPGSGSPREHELVYLLKAQLAEAVNLQNKELVTRLHEVIRCVKLFDADGCKKLLKSLREEYRNRAAYISYLVRCRQGLLSAVSHLQKMLNRVERDKEIIGKHLINVCVRIFIERHEKRVLQFISMFQKLEMADEKTHLVETFLREMYNDMMQDDLWKAASEVQLDLGQAAIERLLMSRIYSHAMFPNADGDILRDQLTQQHIRKLSGLMSPQHKDLRIPRVYHFECPWPAAQHEILMINAYKTPKDKLKCVLRCSQTIMNLLSLANERSVPAADDFMPVLIFVLIKANPPCLLSTIQYVESFYKNRLHGEEQYWWMQFSSAVEFIKTMEYSTT